MRCAEVVLGVARPFVARGIVSLYLLAQPIKAAHHLVERSFQISLEKLASHNENPFEVCDMKKLTRDVGMSGAIDSAFVPAIIQSAVLWRRNLELSKAKVLGLSRTELEFHKSFGGFLSSQRQETSRSRN